jgi:hypothetical protein
MYRSNIRENAAKVLGVTDPSVLAVGQDGYLIKLKAGYIEPITGKNAELKEDGVVSPGQSVLIFADRGEGSYTPPRGLFHLSYNPVLSQYGIVSTLGIISHLELEYLQITFQCAKKVDLRSLDYVIGVYVHA